MVKEKNIVVCILLTIITCGLYGFYWMLTLTDDSITLAEKGEPSGSTVVLLTIITLGLYGIYWSFVMDKRLLTIEKKRGIVGKSRIAIYVIFYIAGIIITLALMQNKINSMSDTP